MSPVTIRASSLGSLFDCPARWVAIHQEGKRMPQSGNAALGQAIHAGTAVFDEDRVSFITPSLDAAENAAVESIRKPREETIWDEEAADKAEKVARSLTMRYCTLESPKHEFVAVEASVESLHIMDLDLILTGHVDRVRSVDGAYGVVDLKSGKSAVNAEGRANTKGHSVQLGVYELVAEAAVDQKMTAPAQIIGLQTNLTPDKQRIASAEVPNVREVLLGDEERPGLLTIASKLVHGSMPIWGNPKSMMCHQNYCPNFKTCFWRR
jgi:hypothetical protein